MKNIHTDANREGEILFKMESSPDWFNYVLAIQNWLEHKSLNNPANISIPFAWSVIDGLMANCSDFVSCTIIVGKYSFELPNKNYIPFNMDTSTLIFTNKRLLVKILPSSISREKAEQEIREYCKCYVESLDHKLQIKMLQEFFLQIQACVEEDTLPTIIDNVDTYKNLRNIPPFIKSINFGKPGKALQINDNFERSCVRDDIYINILFGRIQRSIQCKCRICSTGTMNCLIDHLTYDYTFTEEHKSRIKQFQNNKISYPDLLEKWQKFYDQEMEKRTTEILEDYFSMCTDEYVLPLWEECKQTNIEFTCRMRLSDNIYNFDWKGPDGRSYQITDGTIFLKE
jgi:hypothetical protein